MIKLYVIQAKFGDCFLLEYGENEKPSYMLIDGGPADVFDKYLKPLLLHVIKSDNIIDDIIISHVDNDHIIGILDLLTALQHQQDNTEPPFLNIGQIWFNSFGNTIGTQNSEARLGKVNRAAAFINVNMKAMSVAINGIKDGSRLLMRAAKLNIPVNKDASVGFYLATNNAPIIKRKNLEVIIAGPTRANLLKLKEEWEEWIRKNEQAIAAGKYTRDVAAALDRSVPNLSSIVMLVKCEGKSILFTGDCRSDHLQQGLIETGLSADGKLHVDILKVPHHGSKRNSNRKFFEDVTADTYIISADGTYNNPDEETMVWIVEAAKQVGRKITIICTNETPSTTSLIKEYNPSSYGYDICFMGKESNYLIVD